VSAVDVEASSSSASSSSSSSATVKKERKPGSRDVPLGSTPPTTRSAIAQVGLSLETAADTLARALALSAPGAVAPPPPVKSWKHTLLKLVPKSEENDVTVLRRAVTIRQEFVETVQIYVQLYEDGDYSLRELLDGLRDVTSLP
jgi:hypothetical protein